VANGLIYQLTWRENTVFVYDLDSFATVTSHFVPTEGWGLTWNGEHLILSDGSDQLYFIEPDTFGTVRTVKVTLGGQPIRNLNELEYINGEVWANVWMSEQLVRIDPANGHVVAVVDLSGLKQQTTAAGPPNEAVLNGIAWDADHERVLVTGKLWSHVFEITVEVRD
jgi:glutaminyl-peptide cyclotransferase